MAETVLELQKIRKQFSDTVVLNGVDLVVKQGEVIVIIGPSGCGKSTLLRCINGLEPIQGGQILFYNERIDTCKDLSPVRQKIGMVFQSYELFPHKTVLENVILAPVKVQRRNKEKVKKEAIELLERMGLEQKINS